MSIVKTAADVSKIIESTFPQEATLLPLFGPEGLKTPHYGVWYGDECLPSAVKRGYTLHTRDDVSALCEAAIESWGGGDANLACTWSNGHYVSLTPPKAARLEVFDGDGIWPRVLIRAGYDGRAFSASMGFYRDACRNLAMPRLVESVISVSFKHTHGLRDKMGDLIADFRSLGKGWDSIRSWATRMESNKVNLAEFLQQVYPIPEKPSDRTRRSYEKRVAQIVRRLGRERTRLGRSDLGQGIVTGWEAYNAVQGYVQHDKRRRGTPSEFDRALMSLNDIALARAEQLALAI